MLISAAKEVVKGVIKYNLELKEKGEKPSKLLNPYLVGDPGIGKTAIYDQIAEELDIEVETIILAQYDSGELAGLPFLDINEEGNKTYRRARPDWIPKKNTGLLVVDEVTQAYISCQNVAAQLANEHRVGEHKLGENWILGFASNKTSNRAGTQLMPTHLRDRLVFLPVETSLDCVLPYFYKVDIHENIIAFLKMNSEEDLANFDPDQDACPSPRSWERVNTVLHNKYLLKHHRMKLIEGQVGTGVASKFYAFLEEIEHMVDPALVFSSPETAPIPANESVLYTLCVSLASRAKPETAGAVVKYLNRLENKPEFSVFTIKDMLEKNDGIKGAFGKVAEIKDWARKQGTAVLGDLDV